jgi:tetratricopeptide (TPR) repeat protein
MHSLTHLHTRTTTLPFTHAIQDAHASFQAAIRFNKAVNYTLLGGIYQGFQQHQHALEAFGTALDEDASDVASLFGYAQSAESLALVDEAQAAYEALLTLAPGHAQAHYA